MDVLAHEDLPFPQSLPGFNAFFPTTLPVLHISKWPVGMVASSAQNAGLLANR